MSERIDPEPTDDEVWPEDEYVLKEDTLNYEAAAHSVHVCLAEDEQWRLQETVTAVQSREAEMRYAKIIVGAALTSPGETPNAGFQLRGEKEGWPESTMTEIQNVVVPPCPTCNGTGRTTTNKDYQRFTPGPCPDCHASGHHPDTIDRIMAVDATLHNSPALAMAVLDALTGDTE